MTSKTYTLAAILALVLASAFLAIACHKHLIPLVGKGLANQPGEGRFIVNYKDYLSHYPVH